jgi:hypothetical protein
VRYALIYQAFLSGYSVAKHELGEQPTKQDRDFTEFPEWIRKKFNVQTSQSWANIILFYSEDETKALDRFFELFDEFIDRNYASDTLCEGELDVGEKVQAHY